MLRDFNVIEFYMPVKKSPLMMLNQRDPMAQLTAQYMVSVLELQHQYLHHKLYNLSAAKGSTICHIKY
jgi:hypothetical protein